MYVVVQKRISWEWGRQMLECETRTIEVSASGDCSECVAFLLTRREFERNVGQRVCEAKKMGDVGKVGVGGVVETWETVGKRCE